MHVDLGKMRLYDDRIEFPFDRKWIGIILIDITDPRERKVNLGNPAIVIPAIDTTSRNCDLPTTISSSFLCVSYRI